MGLDMYLYAAVRPMPELPAIAQGKDYFPNWTYQTPEEREPYRQVLESLGLSALARQDGSIMVDYEFIKQGDDWVTGPASGLLVQVAYWRKANSVHNWFVENCQEGVDDCGNYPVHFEQLADLRAKCQVALEARAAGNNQLAASVLPPIGGFFFGSTDLDEGYDYDLRDTISQVEHVIRVVCDQRLTVCLEYHSSW